MRTVRAFYCLPLPKSLLDGADAWLRSARDSTRGIRGVRFVSRDTLHVTLRFCGEIPEQTVKAIDARLRNELAGALADAPKLTVGELGTFGRPPRVLWAGLSEGAAFVRSLNVLIEKACRDEGLEPDEKRFSPHLTLARFSVPGCVCSDALPQWTLAGQSWTPERIIFMRSTLTSAGPHYTPMSLYERRK